MKTRKPENQTETVQASACCGTTQQSADPCCDQPSDGGVCCDKKESKEVNSVKTGCC